MAVTATLNGTGNELGEVVSYTVTEDATPLVVGESSGSVGQINVSTKSVSTGAVFKRSAGAVGAGIELTDDRSIDGTNVRGRGSVAGLITEIGLPGERSNLNAETILARLNTDRTAKPFFGSYVPASTTTTTRTNYAINPGRETNLDFVALDIVNGGNTANLTRPLTGGVEGAFARATFTNNGNAPGAGLKDTVTGITPLTTYTISNHYRATRATPPNNANPVQRIRLVCRFYNASNQILGDDTVIQATLKQNEWTRVSVAATAPAGAERLEMYCVSFSGTDYAHWKTNDTFDSDMLMVEQGPLMPPFTGSSATVETTDPLTGIVTKRTYAWSGTANASRSVEYTAITTPAYGYNATQGAYFRYLCELVGLQVTSVDPDFENRPVAYPGWTGNVWKYVKDFCAAVGAEVSLINGVIALRRPRLINIPVESISNPSTSVNITRSSQFVEVYNQNSRWGTNTPAFKAETVYQVTNSGYTLAEVTVDHDLVSVNNPVAVDRFTAEYDAGPGQYSIIDSQGLAVSATWWAKNGGRIVASLVPNTPRRVNLEIYGPRTGEDYVGPFQLGFALAGETLPALEITGTGVFINKQVVRVRTGVSAEQTSTVVGTTVENVFLSDANLTYTKALDMASRAAGPVVTLSGTIEYSRLDGQTFGYIAGGRILYADNIYRITNSRISSNGISFDAEGDMTYNDVIALYSYTFDEFNALFPGLSFAAVNTLAGSKTFDEFDTDYPNPTFNYVNSIYDGATLTDHAIFPNISEVIL